MNEQEQQINNEQQHGECCDDCKQKCKRNFWTSVLNAIIKVSTIVLAAFGIQSFTDPPQPSL